MRVVFVALVLALVGPASGGHWLARSHAQAPSGASVSTGPRNDVAGLRAAGRGLRLDSERADSLARLTALGPADLPAIRARIAQIRGEAPSRDAGYAALGEFAEAAGGTGPADPRDLVAGIAAFPAARFTNVHATVAERYCLVRALEQMGTAEALVAAFPLLTFDIRAFRWQARHVVRRSNKRAAAMLIRAASHPNAEVDLWADWGLATLGIRDSGDSVQGQSDESLIEVLRAYATMRHIGGMPVVASFVDDGRIAVRTAARESMALYAENGIWELRRLYTTRLGRDPGNRSWQLLSRELFAGLDERREAPLRDRTTRARAALAAGRLDEARGLAEGLVADAPLAPATRGVAPIYLALAEERARAGALEDASAYVERALRLGVLETHPEAGGLRDELRAALLARRGIVEDLPSVQPPTLVVTGPSAALHTRRRLARVGLTLGFLVFAGGVLLALFRRAAELGLDAGLRVAASVRARLRTTDRARWALAAKQATSRVSHAFSGVRSSGGRVFGAWRVRLRALADAWAAGDLGGARKRARSAFGRLVVGARAWLVDLRAAAFASMRKSDANDGALRVGGTRPRSGARPVERSTSRVAAPAAVVARQAQAPMLEASTPPESPRNQSRRQIPLSAAVATPSTHAPTVRAAPAVERPVSEPARSGVPVPPRREVPARPTAPAVAGASPANAPHAEPSRAGAGTEPAHARRSRPTRRAIADAELFTSPTRRPRASSDRR